jgi:predicted Zn-ribbon and HTH transcriptional regulator
MEQEKVIEFLRRQAGVSYEKAKDALQHANNDIIEAIIMLKGKKAVLEEHWQVHGPEVRQKVNELLKEAKVIRITVSRKGKQLLVIPAWLGVASFVFFPIFMALTTLTLLYNDVSLTVDRMKEA